MKKPEHKNTIRATVVIILLAVFIIIGIVSVSLIENNMKLEIAEPFDASTAMQSSDLGMSSQVADSFAQDLCVASGDVELGGLTFPETEKLGLFSLDDKKVMYASRIHEKAYPASVTKIMTAILALENGNMNDTVTITWRMLELESGSQVCGFKVGDKVKMSELFRGLLVHSGNDAAMAIAEHVGGTIPEFVEMMNKRAKELGATETHFTNPSGLQDPDHYTSIYDIYLMLNKARTYQEFADVIQLRVYELHYTDAGGAEKTVNLDSTDQYLTGEKQPPKDVTILGGKTGTTDEAGSCLALLTQNIYGKAYISIVFGADSKFSLYDHMNQLLGKINTREESG